jgi:uncharacterized protein (TIGR04255 family)
MPTPLPSFDQPPIVETVLGVQFVPIPGFRTAHLGAFWKELGHEWNEVIDAPPLQLQHERFDDSAQVSSAGLRLSFVMDSTARIQIRNKARDRMVQLQNGRLHYNWIATEGTPYPRFETVHESFDKVLERLQVFLARENLQPFIPDQWELTYVNHLLRGRDWNSPEAWASSVFRAMIGPTDALSAVRFEACAGTWSFELPPKRGRLHVEVQPALLVTPTPGEVLVLKLTARGPISEHISLGEGLNLGHETIVRTFAEVTAPEAQRRWGRTT